ncbi:MAG: 16S rRNA (cytosine(1402)-N(4))-methyltransferase RsmH [Patescibacteria group bacterium]
MEDIKHIAVLVEECLHALNVHPGGTYVDATLGGGTHTSEILAQSAPDGRVASFDVDPTALKRASERFASAGERWIGIEANFRHIAEVVREKSLAPVDGILIDLGFSSDELADRTKGLSFLEDGPLDMRLGPQANEDGLTAAEIVNSWQRFEIEKVLKNFGEEKFAYRISEAIVTARKTARIIGTLDLVAIIRQAVPHDYEHGRIHPATRTFQALRIAVNDELENLKRAINGSREILKTGGRLAIISFHSLEDRIVKQQFRDAEDLIVITKKPLIPSEEEQASNPRSRSAKLRIAEKIS